MGLTRAPEKTFPPWFVLDCLQIHQQGLPQPRCAIDANVVTARFRP